MLPTLSSSYFHAERYAVKTNWGWSNVYTGFTGNGYMEPTDSVNSIQYAITTTKNGLDSIAWTYSNTKSTDLSCALYVNGTFNQTVVFKPTTAWSTKSTGLNLSAGSNTVQLVSQSSDGIFLDRYTITYIGPYSGLNAVAEDNTVLQIYPSTVHTQATIHISQSQQQSSTLRIYNSKGTKVREIQVPSGTAVLNFNREGLTSGIYLLQLLSTSGIATIRFIVD